jgi:hypothetical protein
VQKKTPRLKLYIEFSAVKFDSNIASLVHQISKKSIFETFNSPSNLSLGMGYLVDQLFFLSEIQARQCEMSTNHAF